MTKTSYPVNGGSVFFSSQPSTVPFLLSDSVSFTILDSTYKCVSCSICLFCGPLPVSWCSHSSSLLPHMAASPFVKTEQYSMQCAYRIFCTHSSAYTYLAVNNVSINIAACIYLFEILKLTILKI